MKINLEKSYLLTSLYSGAKITSFLRLLHVQYTPLEEGVKYLVFHLKPDKYKKSDWAGLSVRWKQELTLGFSELCPVEAY
jgi:hypothetical protein